MGIIALIILFQLPLQAREVQTTIGEWKMSSGYIKASIVENNGKKTAQLFVSDNDIINTVLFMPNKNDLVRLKKLIDQTIDELETKNK